MNWSVWNLFSKWGFECETTILIIFLSQILFIFQISSSNAHCKQSQPSATKAEKKLYYKTLLSFPVSFHSRHQQPSTAAPFHPLLSPPQTPKELTPSPINSSPSQSHLHMLPSSTRISVGCPLPPAIAHNHHPAPTANNSQRISSSFSTTSNKTRQISPLPRPRDLPRLAPRVLARWPPVLRRLVRPHPIEDDALAIIRRLRLLSLQAITAGSLPQADPGFSRVLCTWARPIFQFNFRVTAAKEIFHPLISIILQATEKIIKPQSNLKGR